MVGAECVFATQTVFKGKTAESCPSLKKSKATIQDGHQFMRIL